MTTITLSLPDELAQRLREYAQQTGQDVNTYAVATIAADLEVAAARSLGGGFAISDRQTREVASDFRDGGAIVAQARRDEWASREYGSAAVASSSNGEQGQVIGGTR